MTIHESILDGLTEVRTHKLRTFLQTLGVILGVGSLVAVQGLVDAGRRQTLDFWSEIGGLKKILVRDHPPKETRLTARQLASSGLTLDDAEAIRSQSPHATLVDPVAETTTMVRFGSYQRRREIAGVTQDYPSVYRFYPAKGRFITADDVASQSRVVVLGDTSARTYFGNEDPLGKVLYVGDVGFTVVGVMKKKEFFFNDQEERNALEWMNRMTFVPLTSVYTRLTGDTEKRVDYVNVMVDSAANSNAAVESIRGVLLRRHGGVQDFEVVNRSDRLARSQEEGRVFDVTFLVTGIVSLVVGGIVIMNIMLASFQERIREVGVRKAIGAKGSDVAVQFLVESVLVTSIGGALGLLAGIAFAKGISTVLGSPAIITPKMALVGVIASVTTGLFFGMYPAIRASRLNPVEALRYE